MTKALNSLRTRLRVIDKPIWERFLDSKLSLGIVIIDDEMRIIWTNTTFANWFGSRSKLHGICSTIHRSLGESCLACPAVSTFETGKIQCREQSAINRWGEEKLYRFTTVPLRDKMGVVVRAMELIEDVSQLPIKQPSSGRRKLDESPLFAIFCLDQDGKIVSTNPEHIRISQAPPNKVIGVNWLKVPMSEEFGLSEHLTRGLNGQPFELHNFRYATYKADKEIYIDLKGLPLQRTDGKIDGLLCIMQDRTEEINRETKDCPIIGESQAIKTVKKIIARVAPYTCHVLVQGESGTGKELVAREIHRKSRRADNPFVAVNGAAFQDTLLESELFGYTRGAFTGADQNKKGLLEIAHNGTFFLDEIGDISPSMQAKLLRVLETGTFRPLGDVREVKVNVRFITATNKNLEAEVKNGSFREDLYYRLNVVKISLPPLRERKDDIPLLLEHFLANGEQSRQEVTRFSQNALNYLMKYRWPGNIRELANLVERVTIMVQNEEVEVSDFGLPEQELEQSWQDLTEPSLEASSWKRLAEFMEQAEKDYILQVIGKTEGNKEKAAELLDISLRSLYRKIAKHEIDDKNQVQNE